MMCFCNTYFILQYGQYKLKREKIKIMLESSEQLTITFSHITSFSEFIAKLVEILFCNQFYPFRVF